MPPGSLCLPPCLPPRLAVVLSAGGPVAWMFHLGVLDALETALHAEGRDRAAIELMVGTSAGAAVAAAFTAGASTSDIAAVLLDAPTTEQWQRYVAAIGGLRTDLGGRFRPLAPRLARDVLPGGRGLALGLSGILPPGLFPTTGLGDLPAVGDGWPKGLWIPSVEAATGQVVVFGRDNLETSLPDAVEASSAVPALFRPKQIDGVDFVDGGVVSSTHAGLTAEIYPDLVCISSVQTRPGARPIRAGARRRLAQERAALTSRGIESVVIEPDEETTALATGFPHRGTTVAADLIERGRCLAALVFDGCTSAGLASRTVEELQ